LQITSENLLSSVYIENKYTFVDKIHKDQWQKNVNYPDENKRPWFIVFKTVKFFPIIVPNDKKNSNIQEDEVLSGFVFYSLLF
jgi:hypothetical protein